MTAPVTVPVDGFPVGVSDPRNPTLVPNFDKPTTGAGIGGGSLSPAAFLAANPRTDAEATATIGGTFTAADVVTLALSSTQYPGGVISHSYTVVGGETAAVVADALADAFNDDPVARQFGIYADTAGAVVTFHQGGPAGNLASLTAPTDPPLVTVGGTALTGDAVFVLFTGPNLPGGSTLVEQPITTSQNATTMGTNLKNTINANSELIGAGISATNSAGAVSIAIPAAVEPITVTTWVNTAAPTATIGGTNTPGDVLSLIFTGAGIAGSPVTISHTAVLGETLTDFATALAAGINANPSLGSAGIEATSSGAVISVLGFDGPLGQVRLTKSVTGAATESITITTAPTTTSVGGSSATETVIIGTGATPIVSASATALLAGTETDGDVISLVFTNAGVPGLPVTISHTAAGSESIASIAAALNTAINANATLAAAGIKSTISTATLTITQPGAIGNTTVLSYTQGGNSETITFTPSNGHMGGGTGVLGNALAGGGGPVIPTGNFTYSFHGSVMAFWYGQPAIVEYQMLLRLIAEGQPIV